MIVRNERMCYNGTSSRVAPQEFSILSRHYCKGQDFFYLFAVFKHGDDRGIYYVIQKMAPRAEEKFI